MPESEPLSAVSSDPTSQRWGCAGWSGGTEDGGGGAEGGAGGATVALGAMDDGLATGGAEDDVGAAGVIGAAPALDDGSSASVSVSAMASATSSHVVAPSSRTAARP